MRLVEALRRVEAILVSENRQERKPDDHRLLYRSGALSVDVSGVQRGLISCLYCGQLTGMGSISLQHDDGRSLEFAPWLFHYAHAGHPTTAEEVDGETLLAMVADA